MSMEFLQEHWLLIGLGGMIIATFVGGAVKVGTKRLAKSIWDIALPLMIPLALVGAVEMYNKIQIGVAARPWVAPVRIEQSQQYGSVYYEYE